MNKFAKDALRLERFIRKRLPLKAKPTAESLAEDSSLASKFEQDEVKEFDGVVYFPKTKTVYCSYYDTTDSVAVLVPVTDLQFEDPEVVKKVSAFSKKYFV